MANPGKGLLAGLVATAVLSALMLLKGMLGLLPGLNVIKMLSGMLGVGIPVAWIVHFAIGAIWGLLFALTWRWWPGTVVVKGMAFATVVWLLMMIFVMPMAGAGFFGLNLGIMAPIMTLVLHWVFGAVMGGIVGRPRTV